MTRFPPVQSQYLHFFRIVSQHVGELFQIVNASCQIVNLKFETSCKKLTAFILPKFALSIACGRPPVRYPAPGRAARKARRGRPRRTPSAARSSTSRQRRAAPEKRTAAQRLRGASSEAHPVPPMIRKKSKTYMYDIFRYPLLQTVLGHKISRQFCQNQNFVWTFWKIC